jgi:hypothetical protein
VNDTPIRKPSWEIRRQLGAGRYTTYAHGYWSDPFVVVVLGKVIFGKRALRRRWAAHNQDTKRP